MPRNKRQRARLARALTIVTAIGLLLVFLLRDVVRENLKDVHDSLAQAEAQYRAHIPQSVAAQWSQEHTLYEIQRQIFADAEMHKDRSTYRAPNQSPWDQLATVATHVMGQAEVELDSVSDLIDALPPGATDLRKMRNNLTKGECRECQGVIDFFLRYGMTDLRKIRDESRSKLDLVDTEQTSDQLFVGNVQQTQLNVLGILALASARRELQVMERRIRICSYTIYALGCLVLALGIYAAVVGLKVESADT